MFIIIVGIIFVMQIILVTFAGFAFGVYSYYGLHPVHWVISVTIYLFLDCYWIAFFVGGLFIEIPACQFVPGERQR